MSIEWIEYKGKKILYLNYSGLTSEQRVEQIKEGTRIIVETHSDNNLTLTDMRDCYVDDAFIEMAKQNGKITLPHTYKAAVVGITGIKKLLLNVVNSFTVKPRITFNTVEEAKEWLIQ